MRLISCYIENFGGLSRFSQDFAPGLTVIRQPNGFGKTTLAEFIRAMFYGFPRKVPKQLGKRQKYRPWNGGKYGGHLTFEHEGRQYRIERSFGAVPRGDSFRLIDLQTGQDSSRFPEEIGQALFGLDADSFERSTYLPQSREAGPLTTDSIRAKLGGLVEDTADVGNFEKAVAALRAKRSGYVPYRGAGGAVAEAQGRITRIQQALDDGEEKQRRLARVSADLAECRAEQERVTQQIGTLRRQIRAAGEAAACLAHHQHHDRLTAALSAAQTELEELKERFPGGFPGADALEAAADGVERAAQLAANPPVTAEDRRAERFVENHQERFAGGIPGSDEFDTLRRAWDDRRMALARLDACVLPEAEARELEGLKAFFAPGVPEEETLRRHERDLERAQQLRKENARLMSQSVQTVPCKIPSPLTVPLLLGCGAAGLAAGVLLLMANHTAPGTIALTLGLLALLAAGYVNLRRGMTRQVAGMDPGVRELIRDNEARAAALEDSAGQFMAEYAGTQPGEIRRRSARMAALAERDASFAKKRWELNALVAEYDGVLDAFHGRYRCRPEADSFDAVNRFQRECEAWERACRQLADRDERLEAHRRETQQALAVLEQFAQRYGTAPRTRAGMTALRDAVRRAGELEVSLETLGRQIEEYRREHAGALASPVPEGTADPAALQRREAELLARQSRIHDELLRLGQEQRQLREEADRLPELRDELARWQDVKCDSQTNAAMLDDTLEFLNKARDSLSTAYLGPIRESFAGLMERMAGEDPAGILVTAEMEVRLQRGGASRELEYFSAGQTDLVMLCMRLALVDALFREAKPFVILDDPFVNLDDLRTREALELLEELSRDRQIVYLVCNSSRVSESFAGKGN